MAENSCVTYYYDLWPSILSTVCMVQVGLSLAVGGITSWSGLTILPIVVGSAGSIANGFSYYLFYTKHPLIPTMIASAITDLMWLIQEAGLSFYSYLILVRILRPVSKRVFLTLFWTFMLGIVACRMTILVFRMQTWSMADPAPKQAIVNQLHLGFFVSLAFCESTSSFFLLRSFLEARSNAKQLCAGTGGSIIGQLIRNTEMRVAVLALIGISRAVTHAILVEHPATNGIAAQLDRFVYVLECTFPFLMIFDILASRIASANDQSLRSLECAAVATASVNKHGLFPSGSARHSVVSHGHSQSRRQSRYSIHSSHHSHRGRQQDLEEDELGIVQKRDVVVMERPIDYGMQEQRDKIQRRGSAAPSLVPSETKPASQRSGRC